jgi:hypothetical protein
VKPEGQPLHIGFRGCQLLSHTLLRRVSSSEDGSIASHVVYMAASGAEALRNQALAVSSPWVESFIQDRRALARSIYNEAPQGVLEGLCRSDRGIIRIPVLPPQCWIFLQSCQFETEKDILDPATQEITFERFAIELWTSHAIGHSTHIDHERNRVCMQQRAKLLRAQIPMSNAPNLNYWI